MSFMVHDLNTISRVSLDYSVSLVLISLPLKFSISGLPWSPTFQNDNCTKEFICPRKSHTIHSSLLPCPKASPSNQSLSPEAVGQTDRQVTGQFGLKKKKKLKFQKRIHWLWISVIPRAPQKKVANLILVNTGEHASYHCDLSTLTKISLAQAWVLSQKGLL